MTIMSLSNSLSLSLSLAPYQCQNPESPPQNHWTDGLQHNQSSVMDGVQLTLPPPALVAIALEKWRWLRDSYSYTAYRRWQKSPS